METLADVMEALEAKGSADRVKLFAKHGAPSDNMFGVKVADLKVIAKKIKGRQDLAGALYGTGNGDAMYLAGLVARGAEMSREELDAWAKSSTWQTVSEYPIAWLATEHAEAREIALGWIDSDDEAVASSGWCTYTGHVAVTPDAELDLGEIKALLARIEDSIDAAPNRVKYTMNGFVISVGCYVTPLVDVAKATAERLGKVSVDMNGTACKVPLAGAYIEKVEKAGRLGKKRKTIRC
ncbi:MAG: DNA alkylation repair protein [Acidobacteriota bacterium]